VRLRLDARGGLSVSAPAGLAVERVIALVASRADWIAERLREQVGAGRPQAFDLPALNESWRIEYRKTDVKTVAARTQGVGRIAVSGAVEDAAACEAALRRWLARRAKETLVPWLMRVSAETGLRYSDVALKNQRTRWGSCTAQGRISLNCKLLFLPRDLVRYVLVHELCHTRQHNHSSRFWAVVRRYEPEAETMRRRMREAWQSLPPWAQGG
jgi:predicted metal-dependent hydrolase